MDQSKLIAGHLIKSSYADSLLARYKAEVAYYQKQWELEEQIRLKLNHQLINFERISDNQDQSIDALNNSMDQLNKKLKRAKWQKTLLGLASAVLTVAIILKQ